MYADEFQNYASAGFAVILSEARKYALSLTLGHQYLGQLSDHLRQAVLGNAASTIAFRVGAEDAPLLAKHLSLTPMFETSGLGVHEIDPTEQLVRLPDFRAIARTLDEDGPIEPKLLDMVPPPEAVNRHPERLIENSRVRFGRDRKAIEHKLRRFLGG